MEQEIKVDQKDPDEAHNLSKVVNKLYPEFFVKRSTVIPVYIEPLPIDEIINKFEPKSQPFVEQIPMDLVVMPFDKKDITIENIENEENSSASFGVKHASAFN